MASFPWILGNIKSPFCRFPWISQNPCLAQLFPRKSYLTILSLLYLVYLREFLPTQNALEDRGNTPWFFRSRYPSTSYSESLSLPQQTFGWSRHCIWFHTYRKWYRLINLFARFNSFYLFSVRLGNRTQEVAPKSANHFHTPAIRLPFQLYLTKWKWKKEPLISAHWKLYLLHDRRTILKVV